MISKIPMAYWIFMEKFRKVFEFSVTTFFLKFVALRPTLDCWDGEARRIFFSFLFIFFSYSVQNYIVTYPHYYSVIKESWRALRSIYHNIPIFIIKLGKMSVH